MSLILSGTDGLSDVDGTAATPAIRGTDANTGIFFPAADTIAFSEGGAEAMRITSASDVGIGTSSPQGRLEIRGAGADDSQLYITTSTKTSTRIGYIGLSNKFGMDVNAALQVRIANQSYATSFIANQYGIGVGDTTPSSGTGIAFPATQSASSDANTLDDYEEGTWTPTLSASGGTVTYSSQVGRYVKVGTQVTVSCYLAAYFSAGAGANAVTIGGLPFTTKNTSNLYQGPSWGQIDNIDWPVDAKQLVALSVPNTTTILPYWAKSGAGVATVKSNEWDNVGGAVIISYTYISE